jgi:hypothetical protein
MLRTRDAQAPDGSADVAPRPRRRLLARRAAAAPSGPARTGGRHRAAGAAGGVLLALGRIVGSAVSLIVLLIVLAIVLRDVGANTHNDVVRAVHDSANVFAGPFTGMFTWSGHAKREITVNWGIAAVLYLVAGALLANWLTSLGISGIAASRRRHTLPA